MALGASRLRHHAAAYVVVFLVALEGSLAASFPKARGYVNDFAAILDEATVSVLEAQLRETERDTSAEIAVVTIPSLEGMTIEEYANRLFSEWRIGKKGRDNGALLLIAPNERSARIEVGYGLEPILPDGLAGEIIRTELIPQFRNGNYALGVQRGADRLIQVVRRDPAAVVSTRPAERWSNGAPPALLLIPFFSFFVAAGAFGAGIGMRTKTFGPLIWAALFGGIPFIISSIFHFLASVAVLLPVGLAMTAWGYRKGQSEYWTRVIRPGPGSALDDSPTGWVMGTTGSSDGGGSGSDSGSSGGDFGGGDSSGGGASGSW